MLNINVFYIIFIINIFNHACINITDNNNKYNDVVDIIDSMPFWPAESANPKYDRNDTILKNIMDIEKKMEIISKYKLTDIRKALIEISKRDRQGDEEKMFILNKYLFNIPKTIKRDSNHFTKFLDGWDRIPITGDRYHPQKTDELSARWPWEEGADGKWHLIGRDHIRNGMPYNAVEKFDYYKKEFGKRENNKSSVKMKSKATGVLNHQDSTTNQKK
jgi:hypothetical protein